MNKNQTNTAVANDHPTTKDPWPYIVGIGPFPPRKPSEPTETIRTHGTHPKGTRLVGGVGCVGDG